MTLRIQSVALATVATLWAACVRADFKPIGVNLAAVNYYATELPFKDVMRNADQWRLNGAIIGSDHAQLDAQGWVREVQPGQTFISYLLWDLNAPAYRYLGNDQLIVRYEGEGTMTFQGGYRVVSQDAANKRIVLAPQGGGTPTQGIELKITSTNPANYLRNIRVTKPEFETNVGDDPWDPTFLAHWQDMDALRFMDWGATNSSPLAAWADRTPGDFATQAGRRPADGVFGGVGASYEAMIALCNRLDEDLWLCVPHKADDAYVASLAELVAATLEPGRRVYVEHSNEVWNSIFSQYGDSVARANQLIAQGQSQLNSGAGDFGNAIRYHGQRTKEIGQIFDAALVLQR